MPSKKNPSKQRVRIAAKFHRTTAAARDLRYGTMRKVSFDHWDDVGRFAEYADRHLKLADQARGQMDYWQSLYQLLTEQEVPATAQARLTSPQRREFRELQEQVQRLTPVESRRLAGQLSQQHGATLELLQKMRSEGILEPDFAKDSEKIESKPNRSDRLSRWAVARDAKGRPLIADGQLQLYPTAAPTAADTFRQALDAASKFRSDCGASAKLSFFMGYLGRSAWQQALGRPFLNSLTRKEKLQIQATNRLIEYFQRSGFQPVSKSSSPSKPMPSPASKKAHDSTPATPSEISELPPSLNDRHDPAQIPAQIKSPVEGSPTPWTFPSSGIINHITINGAMHGDIGYQGRVRGEGRENPG